MPEFNAGAMENPGCVTFRDPLSSRAGSPAAKRHRARQHDRARDGAPVVRRHRHPEVVGRPVAQRVVRRVPRQPGDRRRHGVRGDRGPTIVYSRRQWGLVADQGPSTHPVAGNGAVDASAALQDFDGISYAKGSGILRQLNASIGDEVFFDGVIDHLDAPPLRRTPRCGPVRELGARRCGRARRLHDQLAAHRRPGHDPGAGPGSGRRPSYSASGPPGRPTAHHPGRGGRRRRLDRRTGWRSTPPRRRWPTWPEWQRRSCFDPYSDTLGASVHGRDHRPGPGRPAAGRRGPTAARRDLEQPALRLPQRGGRPRRRARRRRGEPPGGGHRGHRTPHDALGLLRSVVPLTADPDAAARVHAAAVAKVPATGPDRSSSSPRSAPSCRTTTDVDALRAWADGRGPARRRRPRRRPALAGPRPAGDPRGTSTPTSSTASSPPTPPAPHGCTTPAHGVAARPRRPRPMRGPGSPARWTCPTTSSRPPASACGAGARRRSPSRTSSASSPTSPRRSGCAAAGSWRTLSRTSSRAPRSTEAHPRPGARAGRRPDLDLSMRRRLVDEADDLERAAGRDGVPFPR